MIKFSPEISVLLNNFTCEITMVPSVGKEKKRRLLCFCFLLWLKGNQTLYSRNLAIIWLAFAQILSPTFSYYNFSLTLITTKVAKSYPKAHESAWHVELRARKKQAKLPKYCRRSRKSALLISATVLFVKVWHLQNTPLLEIALSN